MFEIYVYICNAQVDVYYIVRLNRTVLYPATINASDCIGGSSPPAQWTLSKITFLKG